MRPFLLVLLLLGFCAACIAVLAFLPDRAEAPGSHSAPAPPQRMVSTVPSITEVLVALGLCDRIVGVSDFCKLPPECGEKRRVGGYFDPDYEAFLELKPDLVLTMPQQSDLRRKLETLGLRTLVVRQEDIAGILGSIIMVGKACGVAERAEELVAGLRRRIEAVERSVRGLRRPRVLVCVERSVGSGGLEDIFAAGGTSFYQELIEKAGGVNVLSAVRAQYPSVSKEEVLKLDPEVIVDLVPGLGERGLSAGEAEAEWNELKTVAAVRAGRVYLIADRDAVVPGPGIVGFLEKLAAILHPELREAKRGGRRL